MPYVQWQLMQSLVTHLGTDFVNAELELREKIFGANLVERNKQTNKQTALSS
jgi:hypothetical protein